MESVTLSRAVDTPAIWELNIWYHTLNCGMTSRISGETDFPCIYGDRVGLGRNLCEARRRTRRSTTTIGWKACETARSYCGDGLSHILDFKVNGCRRRGTRTVELSELRLDAPKTVDVTFDATALLEETPTS